MKRPIYLQICTIFIASLLSFAVLSGVGWHALGHDEFNRQLYQKSSALASLLLPPATATTEEQQVAINKIAKAMEVNISLFSKDRAFIAASGSIDYPSRVDLSRLQWVSGQGQSHWTTRMLDDRLLVIRLNRLSVPNDTLLLAVFLGGMLVVVSATSYPFIRRLTQRLENLQKSVEHIGNGDFNTRIPVSGHDEITLLSQSFNHMADKLEKLIEAQRLLLANASHELRTPLARIRLGIELLEKEDSTTRRETIKADIIELDALIHELLFMARLDANVDGDKVELDLMALVAEESARYRGCELSGIPVSINGNLRMLQYLIRNLLDNAFKHGQPPVQVTMSQCSDEVVLAVVDQGEGISDSEQEKIFEPFYRAKNKQNIQGFGLGLSIVYKIVMAHQAQIVISREPSSIIIRFPAIKRD